jgi:pilus assembly protein Flp/PilA
VTFSFQQGLFLIVLCSGNGTGSMRHHIIAFLRDERAATAIEYGLIATGIAVAIIPVLTGVGTKTKAVFTAIQTALK